MKKRWPAIGAVLLVVLWFSGAFREHYVIEIPEGYTGPVVIFFGHPQGTRPGWPWGRRHFRVPRDGIVRIKSKMPSVFNEEWAFVSPDGKRKPIPDLDGIKAEDWLSVKSPGVIQNVTSTQGDDNWIQASIVLPSDQETILENPHFVAERVKEEIRRLKENPTTARH